VVGLFLLVSTACHEGRRTVQMTGVDVSPEDAATLGLGAEALVAQCSDILAKDTHFRPVGEAPALKLGFTVLLARERKTSTVGSFAEVAVMAGARRKGAESAARYDVTGLGEAKLLGTETADRQKGFQEAFRRGVAISLDALRLQLDAVDKKVPALTRDLNSKDARVRDAALRVLAERREPVAVPELIKRLNDPDPDEVRRAMGDLVQIGDPRAVPPLIDLVRGKDPGFIQEVVYAIGAIGGEDAEAYLYTVAQGHELPTVREAAKEALKELHARGAGDKGNGRTP
jgi:HEAT repeat protein